MTINSKSTRVELRAALKRVGAFNQVLVWLYVIDGQCGSGRQWRRLLLEKIRPVMIGDAEHVCLLEWMIESHNSFDSKNEWRQEFINKLRIAVGL